MSKVKTLKVSRTRNLEYKKKKKYNFGKNIRVGLKSVFLNRLKKYFLKFIFENCSLMFYKTKVCL